MGTEFYIQEVISVNLHGFTWFYKKKITFTWKNNQTKHKIVGFALEFGLACQLGVLVDIPSLGVAKKLFQVDGLEKNDDHKQKVDF